MAAVHKCISNSSERQLSMELYPHFQTSWIRPYYFDHVTENYCDGSKKKNMILLISRL